MYEKLLLSNRDARRYYDELIPAYQEAFGGEPWYEVSKCADKALRCAGGFSAIAVGSLCGVCERYPRKPAYEDAELIESFEQLGETKKTVWYLEKNDAGVALAAIAWVANARTTNEARYANTPGMDDWIEANVQAGEYAWLDEVFAQKSLRPTGNLNNFRSMCDSICEALDVDTMAFRTINPAMTQAAQRDFKDRTEIYERLVAVPDRRDFVIIRPERIGQ